MSMKKNEAKTLVDATFSKPYEEERYRYFIRNLLPDGEEERKASRTGQYIAEAFEDKIESYKRIAKYTDPEGLKIDVLAVELRSNQTLENARTTQRNFIGRYLKKRDKYAALVAFYSKEDKSNWRFSLVVLDYDIRGDKVVEQLTPAKRYSFLVGENENTHTAQSRLLSPLTTPSGKVSLAELEDAFNIETVTKEFFEQYKTLYLRLKEALDKHLEKDPVTKKEFTARNIGTPDFAKRLLGQIVFLYFLQKKGWLGVEKGKEWGTGPKNFMQRLYEQGNYGNFFNDVLEHLFYDALATERQTQDHFYAPLGCKIPFLNGGLFEPFKGYAWDNTDILLDNAIFSEIFEVFDLYNFTVREDEPLDKEVAVDPEMLGKVFENLIPENERKGSGTFYTPREIVHYMCQESLIGYLDAKLNIESRPVQKQGQQALFSDTVETDLLTEYEDTYTPRVPRDDLAEFIYHGDVAQEHDATAQTKNANGDYKGDYRHKIPASVREHAQEIDDVLAAVKICDPAIGSGAFPVGVMNEIVRARSALNAYLGDQDRTPYDFKRHAIQESIYGVDIEPSAVDIAKLRLWLSLVVDEEDFGTIKPLPNLEYKIMAGNSLLSVEKNLFNNSQFEELERLKDSYFDETRPSEKISLKNRIEELNLSLSQGQKNFDIALNFSEVFRQKNGFDLVIANPPYLKERDNKHVFEEVNASAFGKKYHQGKMDYWFYFLHLGIDIVRRNGTICFITSRYWLNSFGAKNLIKRVKENLTFRDVVDIGKLKVFDSVAGHHMVHLYSRNHLHDRFRYKKLENDVRDINESISVENVKISSLTNSAVFSNGEIIFAADDVEFQDCVHLGLITESSIGVQESVDKISNKQAKNSQRTDIQAGSGVFVLSKKEREALNANNAEQLLLKRYLDPNSVIRYGIKSDSEQYLIYSDAAARDLIANNSGYSNLKMHLDFYREFITSSNAPYGLHRSRKRKFFEQPKIIFKNMFVTPEFTYDEKGFYVGFSFSLIIQKDKEYSLKYILGIINSKLAMYWFSTNGKQRGAGLDIGVEKLRLFPVKKADAAQQKPLIEIVERLIAEPESSNSAPYIKKIDQLVYQLYGLTPEEIAIVEEAVS
ncbi:MAG: Eco57I restriction-modification methylase domain-containing protein [Rhodospirillales bacterium]|nr:Eco57I restriction-modification methylase domain-containing protein [Rhodospirillales bacterium]